MGEWIMQSIQMGLILQKRGAAITERQWARLLDELEQVGLYLVLESPNQCMAISPVGGFIPSPSKDDELHIYTQEQLLQRDLPLGHHIIRRDSLKEKET
jgi:hypothetical protein